MGDDAPAGWYVYRFRTRSRCAIPDRCRRQHPLYIGKSNEPLRRLLEHARRQWWWHLASGWDVDVRVFATEAEAFAAETAAIRAELPLVNKQGNERNPHRLREPATPRQRRPRARRVPAHPEQTRSRRPARRSGMSPRWLWPAVGVACVWMVLAGLGWWAVAELAPSPVAVGRAPGLGAIASTMVLGWAWIQQRPRKRGWLTAPLLVAAVGAALYLLAG